MISVDSSSLDLALLTIVGKLGDLTNVYQNLGEYMQLRTRERFDNEQGPSGAKWKPLKPGYKAYKQRKGLMTGINVRRGLLRDMMAYQNDRTQLLFGSPQDYAQYVNDSRPWLELDARDESEIEKILYSFIN